MAKKKLAFGGYSINFKGCKDTMESVMSSSPIGPSELARRALADARVEFESRSLEAHPVDRDGALRLARGAKRFLVKTGAGFVRRDAVEEPVSDAQALDWLLHEDGLLRVPVLVW